MAMVYPMTGSFTAISENRGIIKNLSSISNLEVVVAEDGRPIVGSGVVLKPGQKMTFECAGADVLYARLVTLRVSDRNPAASVDSELTPGSGSGGSEPAPAPTVIYTTSINDWAPGTPYKTGDIVIYARTLLRATANHTSGDEFSSDYWESIGGTGGGGGGGSDLDNATLIDALGRIEAARTEIGTNTVRGATLSVFTRLISLQSQYQTGCI